MMVHNKCSRPKMFNLWTYGKSGNVGGCSSLVIVACLFSAVSMLMSQRMPGEFLQQFPRVIGKGRQDVGSHLLVGHYEEQPIIGRCH